jgi:hypothetical protein
VTQAFLVSLYLAFAQLPMLSLTERCAIVSAAALSRATLPIHENGISKTIQRSFLEYDSVRRYTGGNARVHVRPEWLIGNIRRQMFEKTESCHDAPFVLEHEESAEMRNRANYIVVIALTGPASSTRRRFQFTEQLGFHGVWTPSCCWSVPPLYFQGIVEETTNGKWVATVEKRSWAE